MVQETAFSKEMQSLKKQKASDTQDKAGKLYKLRPFLDGQGILRVGGRLAHATLHPHVKHPAILPRNVFFFSRNY